MGRALKPAHDVRLGVMYRRAVIRLVNDLLASKTCKLYRSYLEPRQDRRAR